MRQIVLSKTDVTLLKEEYRSYTSRLGPEEQKSFAFRREFAFGWPPSHIQPALVRQTMIDEEAVYSVTSGQLADETSRIILEHVDGRVHTITDGSACIGGNTLSFARYFDHVNAIELDPTRAKYLWFNMHLLAPPNKDVKIFQGDITDTSNYAHLQNSIVFLDPPWGGTDYKDTPTDRLELFFGSENVIDTCKKLAPFVSYIALKVPVNFAISQFRYEMGSVGNISNTIHIRNKKRRVVFLLLIVSILPGK